MYLKSITFLMKRMHIKPNLNFQIIASQLELEINISRMPELREAIVCRMLI